MTAYKTAQEWKPDYQAFFEATDQFYSGQINAGTYKGISGGFGSYAQKGGQANMLRLRMAGGRMTKERLKFIVDAIAEWKIDKVHFTTCQAVQLHNLKADAVKALSVAALDAGIITRGGGGDFPRNVMVSPLSGVEVGEYFNVTPYAEAAGDFLLAHIDGPRLPRKLKCCFSNSPANAPHATYRDLGFVAREDGRFDVYAAGGLGNNPRFGVKVTEGVEPSQVLYYIEAMHRTFLTYGNYESRAKARTRYMQESLGGPEGFKAAYLEKLAEVRAEGRDLTIPVSAEAPAKQADGEAPLSSRLIAQKQEGLYTVRYHALGGCPRPDWFGEIYRLIADMEQVELRVAPDETVYIINLTGKEAAAVLSATEDGARTVFEESVSCIGAQICQQGIRDSQGLLAELVEMERREGFADGILPQIHISGCTSSCGTHQTGVIGFHGCVKMINKVGQPAFTLHYGGCDRQGEERMGEKLGVILQVDIPTLLCEVGHAVENSGCGSFAKWAEAEPEAFRSIAARYL